MSNRLLTFLSACAPSLQTLDLRDNINILDRDSLVPLLNQFTVLENLYLDNSLINDKVIIYFIHFLIFYYLYYNIFILLLHILVIFNHLFIYKIFINLIIYYLFITYLFIIFIIF